MSEETLTGVVVLGLITAAFLTTAALLATL
jgi:hypothetical protein